MNTTSHTYVETSSALLQRAQERSTKRRQHEELTELVRLIDKLSGEMGSADFRDAIRTMGYDIDASTPMLVARGVNVNN